MNRLLLTVAEEDGGQTVLFLLTHRAGLSGRRIRSLKFRPEGLRLNGEKVRTDRRVLAGDRLEILLADADERPEKLIPAGMLPPVLYEDGELIAVNKPAGLVCHPSGGHKTDSLANALRAYFDRTDPSARVHLIGRLDKDTSGIVLCAKDAAAAAFLARPENRPEKVYLALAAGRFPPGEESGTICLPLRSAKVPETRLIRTEVLSEDDDGRKARTDYRVLSAGEDRSLLEVRIRTGRTHQIRAHLAALGHPLLGDRLYGGPCGPGMPGRALLHAAELTFSPPLSDKTVRLSAPLPDDFRWFLPPG